MPKDIYSPREFGEKVAAVPLGGLLARAMNGARAIGNTPSFVRNTFKPGFPALRAALRNTARVYDREVPLSPAIATARAESNPLQRLSALNDAQARKLRAAAVTTTFPANAIGAYDLSTNTAISARPFGGPDASSIMRHELLHGYQALGGRFNSGPSLATLAGHLAHGKPGSWREGLGHFLQEANSHAGQNRGVWPQIRGGLNFMFNPGRAYAYSRAYGGKYPFIHGSMFVAPTAATGTAGLIAGNKLGNKIVEDGRATNARVYNDLVLSRLRRPEPQRVGNP